MHKNGHLNLGKVEENHGLAQSGAKAYNYLFNKDTVIVMGQVHHNMYMLSKEELKKQLLSCV